jgi:hypothetical protein
MTELFAALREKIEDTLSPHQPEVLVALALNEVPITKQSPSRGQPGCRDATDVLVSRYGRLLSHGEVRVAGCMRDGVRGSSVMGRGWVATRLIVFRALGSRGSVRSHSRARDHAANQFSRVRVATFQCWAGAAGQCSLGVA